MDAVLALARILERDERIAYALLFGSAARGCAQARDLDVALELVHGMRLDALELGALVGRLEAATARSVDVVLLGEAPPGLAYRIFRDGRPLLVRDRGALVERKARAILEYLDFEPIERLCVDGVLRVARGG